ncbi:MAG: hypothetical protein GXO23_04845 [Crenarchaeota archaeon]|nr:hypothetical protein [Thermoproteota archaeon]
MRLLTHPHIDVIDGSIFAESILYVYKISLRYPSFDNNIDALLHVLDVLIDRFSEHGRIVHTLRMLRDKFRELKEYLDTGLMFHAFNVFRNLYDFVSNVFNNIDDRDLGYLLDRVIDAFISVERFDNVYSCVKSFVRYFSSFDRYLLPVCKFFIMYLILKLLSECSYYGYVDPRVLDLDVVDRLFSNYSVLGRIVNVFDRGELKSLLNYVHMWEMCGLSRAYCRFVHRRDVNEFGSIYCRGRINLDDVRRLLLSCVDMVYESCYEYCEKVRDLVRFML